MALRPLTAHRLLMVHHQRTARRRHIAHRRPLVPHRVLSPLPVTRPLPTQHPLIRPPLIQRRRIPGKRIRVQRIQTRLILTQRIRTLGIRGRTRMGILKAHIRIHGIRGGTIHRLRCRLRRNRRCDFAKGCDFAIPMCLGTLTSEVSPAIKSKVMTSRLRWFLQSRSFSVVRSLGISCRRMCSISGAGQRFLEAIYLDPHSVRFLTAPGKPIRFRPLVRS